MRRALTPSFWSRTVSGAATVCAAAVPPSASTAVTVSAVRVMTRRYAHHHRRRKGSAHACSAHGGQHLLAVGADRAQRIGLADELQADRRRPELLHLADALDGLLGVRADDEALLGELLVGDLVVGHALHLGRVVEGVAVDRVHLRRLPAPGAPDRGLLVLRPGEAGGEDDLAGLAV